MIEATDRQKQILAFIQLHRMQYGYAPSIREMAAHFGVSNTKGIACHIEAMIRKELLTARMYTARSYLLTPKGILALKGVTVELPFDFTKFGEIIQCPKS